MKAKLISALLYTGCILPSFAADIDTVYEDVSITAGTVTLNFDPDGGTECTPLTLIISETPASCTLPTPFKAGHKFLGWHCGGILITGENPYDAFETISLGQVATLKAEWEKLDAETSTSSIVKDEYYETIHRRDSFSDGSQIETVTKTKKIEDYAIEENIIIKCFHQDGSVSAETQYSHNGYDSYFKTHAKNAFNASVIDKDGKPVSGAVINFKTDTEDINLTADSNGKVSHIFNSGQEYKSSIASIPYGYALYDDPEKQISKHDGYASYTEKYTLDAALAENITVSGNVPDNGYGNAASVTINDSTEKTSISASGIVCNTDKNSPTATAANASSKAKAPVILESEQSDSTVRVTTVSTPQTGDNSNILLFGCLNALTLLGILHNKRN